MINNPRISNTGRSFASELEIHRLEYINSFSLLRRRLQTSCDQQEVCNRRLEERVRFLNAHLKYGRSRVFRTTILHCKQCMCDPLAGAATLFLRHSYLRHFRRFPLPRPSPHANRLHTPCGAAGPHTRALQALSTRRHCSHTCLLWPPLLLSRAAVATCPCGSGRVSVRAAHRAPPAAAHLG